MKNNFMAFNQIKVNALCLLGLLVLLTLAATACTSLDRSTASEPEKLHQSAGDKRNF